MAKLHCQFCGGSGKLPYPPENKWYDCAACAKSRKHLKGKSRPSKGSTKRAKPENESDQPKEKIDAIKANKAYLGADL